jgi:hypothetical protein
MSMKTRNAFILFIVVFLAVMFIATYKMPRKFVWNPTFDHFDSQPLGCAVFDSILAQSLHHGYSITKENFKSISKVKRNKPEGILMVCDDDNALSESDFNAISDLMARGNKVMIVGAQNVFAYKIGVNYKSGKAPDIKKIEENIATYNKQEKLYWIDKSKGYKPKNFYFYEAFCNTYFASRNNYHYSCYGKDIYLHTLITKHPASYTNIGANGKKGIMNAIAIAGTCSGKGEYIFVSTPYLFTNYGILDKNNAGLIFRLLNEMKDLPIVRTEAYSNHEAVSMSIFQYLLSQRPLRWALYLTLLTIVLFICFTARRKQRIIPEYGKTENKSLEFTKLIGTLYFQKTDRRDLICEKYKLFAEKLQRYMHIDVLNTSEDKQSFKQISRETGISTEEINNFFNEVRPYVDYSIAIDAKDMKRLIDTMNKIINLM